MKRKMLRMSVKNPGPVENEYIYKDLVRDIIWIDTWTKGNYHVKCSSPTPSKRETTSQIHRVTY